MVNNRNIKTSFTFDDVLLLPAASKVLPNEVDLKTKLSKHIKLNIPLVSAAMDTVTESRTAISMAKQGGIGIIHRNLSIAEQIQEVEKVKRAESLIVHTPLTVSPYTTLGELLHLKNQYGVSSFPVIENRKIVGIVTSRDTIFEEDLKKKVSQIMTKNVITGKKNIKPEEAKKILHKNRIEKLPLVNKKGELAGLITIKDIENEQRYPNANKDKEGRLLVGAAIGPNDDERVEKLLKVECDVLVIDTSHGHSKNVIDAVKRLKKKYDCELIAGNIATKEGSQALISAGVDAVKVGVGPGAICTTRIVTGVGVPQLTAVMDAVEAAKNQKIPVIADGGIRYSGDLTKALAAGANSVMVGSLLAGCEETPGKTVFLNNRKFKQYRGMGSVGAMFEGSKSRYFQDDINEKNKLVPQGIEGVVPYKGTIEEVIYQMLGGLRSGMGLVGAENIEYLRTKAKMVRVTDASVKEGHPHTVKITEEAPNYSLK